MLLEAICGTVQISVKSQLEHDPALSLVQCKKLPDCFLPVVNVNKAVGSIGVSGS